MSSPLPFSIKLSAPGKVILFGEYSVIYNKPAIAATLSLYTKLHLYQTNSDKIELNLSLIDLNESFALKDIQNHLHIAPNDSWDAYLVTLTQAFERFYENTNESHNLSEAQKYALIAFFHCFKKLFNASGGFCLKVDSELPVGAGLGSSASFSTVLSASALMLEHIILKKKTSDVIGRIENGRIIISEKFKDLISELAFSCEKIFHGTPSGVDHNTILSGSMLEFVKSNDGSNKMASINTSPLKILLVNTNVPRSTKKLVANFKQLKENHPDVIECVLNGMENVAKSAVKDLIGFKENQGNKRELETHFGELISLNHNLLRVLGASHPSLEQIVSAANKYNFKAKLTGAGGGGFGFVYIPSNVKTSCVKTVTKELTTAGFKVYDVSLGGPGLEIEELIL